MRLTDRFSILPLMAPLLIAANDSSEATAASFFEAARNGDIRTFSMLHRPDAKWIDETRQEHPLTLASVRAWLTDCPRTRVLPLHRFARPAPERPETFIAQSTCQLFIQIEDGQVTRVVAADATAPPAPPAPPQPRRPKR